MAVETFAVSVLSAPGTPRLLVSERARLECGCVCFVGRRVDTREVATAAAACWPAHDSLIQHFNLLLKESLVEPQARPLVGATHGAAAYANAPLRTLIAPAARSRSSGLWWVRLDLEPIAKREILKMECGFALNHDLYEDGGLQIAAVDADHEHDEAAVYVEFEVWA